jgi:hypothetical protein
MRKLKSCVGLEVLTAVVMRSSLVWDITPCNPVKVNPRVEGTCRLYLQDRIISCSRNRRERWQAEQLACRKFGLYRKEEGYADSKSILIGSPVGQNQPPVPIGSHTQSSEPIGEKKQDNQSGPEKGRLFC